MRSLEKSVPIVENLTGNYLPFDDVTRPENAAYAFIVFRIP